MYITAHRVRDQNGLEAINSFLYLHTAPWEYPPLPEDDPGELQLYVQTIPPGGNRVRSYLDVVAPDLSHWDEIHPAFLNFLVLAQADLLPWSLIIGHCMFRFGVDAELLPTWHHELSRLYTQIHLLHRQFMNE